MNKISLILLIGGSMLTVGIVIVWAVGFFYAGGAIGTLIYFFVLFSIITSVCALLGFILFMVSLNQKK